MTRSVPPRTSVVAKVCRRMGLCRRRHNHVYADLWVMPIRRGEMLQIAGSAVGKIGIIHGRWRARSIELCDRATRQPAKIVLGNVVG